jgi:predicted dehydrogenase
MAPDAARLAAMPAGHAQGYQDCFNLFVADAYAAIGGDVPEGLPTAADGVRSARIIDAVLESAKTRSWQEVIS